MATIHKAQRTRSKLRLGLSGPSGSGKTLSSLLLAFGICGNWEKICIIDTENGSGELYANHTVVSGGKTITIGEYNVITLKEYKPADYMAALKECEDHGIEVAIIDSITHEWKYILESVDRIAASQKNSYTAWGKATPMHDQFIQSILKSSCHTITTVRSKQDYDMWKDANGKGTVTKVGMKPETRDGFEYELLVSLDVNVMHSAVVSKDRTGRLVGMFWDMPFQISDETGRIIKEWHDSGAIETVDRSAPPVVQNQIVSLETPPSAPPLRVQETTLPPVQDKVRDPEDKIKPQEIDDIKRQWSILYELGVQLGKNDPKDEKKKFLAWVNSLPAFKDYGITIAEYFQLKYGDYVGILSKINAFIPITRQEVRDRDNAARLQKEADEKQAQETADMARAMFSEDATTDAPPLIPEEKVAPTAPAKATKTPKTWAK